MFLHVEVVVNEYSMDDIGLLLDCDSFHGNNAICCEEKTIIYSLYTCFFHLKLQCMIQFPSYG